MFSLRKAIISMAFDKKIFFLSNSALSLKTLVSSTDDANNCWLNHMSEWLDERNLYKNERQIIYWPDHH